MKFLVESADSSFYSYFQGNILSKDEGVHEVQAKMLINKNMTLNYILIYHLPIRR